MFILIIIILFIIIIIIINILFLLSLTLLLAFKIVIYLTFATYKADCCFSFYISVTNKPLTNVSLSALGMPDIP